MYRGRKSPEFALRRPELAMNEILRGCKRTVNKFWFMLVVFILIVSSITL